MKHAPFLSEQLCDIQAVLNSGFGWLTNSRFWLLTIADQNQARNWLSKFAGGLVLSAKDVKDRKKNQKQSIPEAIAVAFSFSGLARLGLKETSEHPFPTPFRGGMGSELRAALLRDVPREWQWSDVDGFRGQQTVHVLVAQWWLAGGQPTMPPPNANAFSTIRIVESPSGPFWANGKLKEPFGFRDGLAQPVIRGLRDEEGSNPTRIRQDAGSLYEDRVVDPGEFVLGYRNQYDELTYTPDVEHWAAADPGTRFTLNGSYLAVRQIQQNVEAFNALGKAICAKLMGRSKSGLPLSWKGPPNAQVSDSTADAFRYQVEDANGFMCPKGAHIRRMNPRDSLGVDVKSGIKASKLHRLLRRGRPYLEVTEGEKKGEGLFFIACNADLERQFEFMHQRWMRNFRFVNLNHEDDPIVGSPKAPKMFTIPALPSGDQVSLEAFTQTLGGGYFFLPGIRALEFILKQKIPGPTGNTRAFHVFIEAYPALAK